MEMLMNLLMDKNFYIVISIGTFACYLFLSSCFISIPRDETVIHYLKAILTSLLCWTGGSLLMRLQISPGEQFWYHFSLLGLFTIPIAIYGFLFCVLEITGKARFINICMVVSIVVYLLNVFTGFLLPAPEAKILPDGDVTYIYHSAAGIWIWIAVEVVILIYVTVLAHKKIGTHYEYRRKLGPLLLGILLLFAGNLSCLTSWGNYLPMDALGGVGMAICLAYVIHSQYFFSFEARIIAGAIYFSAVVVSFLPVIFWALYISRISGNINGYERQSVVVFMVVESLWCILVLAFTRRRVEDLLSRRRKYIVDCLTEFQEGITSVVSKKKLYQMIRETVKVTVTGSRVHIFEENDGQYIECTPNGDRLLSEAENARIQEFCSKGQIYRNPAAAVFKYENKVYGFLYVELLRKNKLIYDEVDCIHQIGNSVSGVLKSIHAYEKLYQISIHDSLTGLYNRNYCLECLAKLDIKVRPAGMIYLDMDNFKLYNDLYGESTGDQVLHWCAKQMQQLADPQMQVFRVGANEFLIITPGNEKKKLISFAKQVQKIMLESAEDKPKVIQLITFSIGIAWDGSTAENAEELFRQARRASFYAKENGKNCIEVYEKDLKEKEQEQSSEKGYNQVSPTIFALMAAIDAKDSFTFEHSENVSKYAEKLAAKLGLPKEDIQTAKVAGLLHDIGKIGIQDSILKKKGKLTDEEYSVIKTHVEKSVEMIHFLPHMNYVIPAVLSHHERFDGKGYPNGIKGNDIPLLGRILAVCDSFDAMVSRRAYKDRMSVEYAIGELERGKGTQFDPDVAQAFIELVQEDPSFIVQ